MIATYADARNLLSKLTWKRSWNIVQSTSSFYWSKWTGRPVVHGKPISFSIEPTTACNLGCPECPSGLKQFSRPTGNLRWETHRKIIDEMAERSLYLTFYFQGEPYIHPDFTELVRYASEKGLYTATSTNAHFLTAANARKTVEAGLDRLIISIDGTTQETYASYRIHGQLDKVIEGTKNIIAAKKELDSASPQVIFQFLVVKPNEHQIEEVKKLGKKLGVDSVRFKTAQLYDYKNGHQLMPEQEHYARYRKKPDGTYALKNRMDNHCWRMWNSAVFTWDGNVVPCCFDKDASHKMGNVHDQNFEAIWKDESYENFRKNLFQSRKAIDICSNCSEGTKVWD